MTLSSHSTRRPLIRRPDDARRYDMGRMRADFFADEEETAGRYSISEWWLDPHTEGPHPHEHEEDHVFYVLSGTLSLFLDGEWHEAPRGTCAVIPGGTQHTFENGSAEQCGFLSINRPGGFEKKLPELVEWFAENPLGDAGREPTG